MAVPTPFHFTPGPATSAQFNTYESAINYLMAPPRCSAFRSAALSPTSGVMTLIGLDGEDYDDATRPSHDTVTNNSRLVAPEAGLYVCYGQVTYAANATGSRQIDIRKNAAGSSAGGTRIVFNGISAAAGGGQTTVSAYAEVPLAATDYLELFSSQNSGAGLAITTGSGLTFMQYRWVTQPA